MIPNIERESLFFRKNKSLWANRKRESKYSHGHNAHVR